MALNLNTDMTTWAVAANEINDKALDKTGDTMEGTLILSQPPTDDGEATRKDYVDTTILNSIVIGQYIGTGEQESQFINLGFTPRAVLVVPTNGLFSCYSSQDKIYGGLAILGYDARGIRIVDGGFEVSSRNSTDFLQDDYYLNTGTKNYIAFR